MNKFSDICRKIEEGRDKTDFLSSGWEKIDKWFDGGFLRKELIVLGGFTGSGKSYFAGQIMWNIARQGFKSAYFSLEIVNSMLVSRLIGAIANIKPTRLLYGKLEEGETNDKITAKAKLNAYDNFMFFYDDIYELSRIEYEIKENKYEFVVVDFIQNVFAPKDDEYSRMSFVALSLQKIAKENNCCILVLSQISNAVAKDKNLTIPEYKGSGSIATVCDIGFYIKRAEYDEKPENGFNTVYLCVKKNRRGLTGVDFELRFQHEGGWIYES